MEKMEKKTKQALKMDIGRSKCMRHVQASDAVLMAQYEGWPGPV